MSSDVSVMHSSIEENDIQTKKSDLSPTLLQKREEPLVKRSLSVEESNSSIERCNYVAICKLVIRKLIDSSLKHGRMIDGTHRPLEQFFTVLEHVLHHGIKAKGLLREKRSFWVVLEQLPKFHSEAIDITSSVREMPNIKSPLGRVRAWLRLALMQKRLADYIHVLVENKQVLLAEHYDLGGFMVDDEGSVLSGLLVGLNVIDFNFDIKDSGLDEPLGVINYGTYLDIFAKKAIEEAKDTTVEMATILDQKNYIEEINRHLSATVENLQQQVKALSTKHELNQESLAIANNNVLQLQDELAYLRRHHVEVKPPEEESVAKPEEAATISMDAYSEVLRKLRDESQLRLDVEREMELQIGLKQEAEMALRLLEKDIHEKQDAVIGLRKQLDDVKDIHLSMSKELQEKESSLAHRTDMAQRLEEKSNQMAQSLADVEQKMKDIELEKDAAEQTCVKLGDQLCDKDTKRTAVETDLKIEREWRTSLQTQLAAEKERNVQLQKELQSFASLKKEYAEFQQRYIHMQKICSEQEETLRDLGSHLSESKLQMEDLKEEQQAIREAQWADDKVITNCTSCEKPFSVARRKHHCRNCGEIFCNECSDHKLQLPSSAKPVRVCDGCVVRLQTK